MTYTKRILIKIYKNYKGNKFKKTIFLIPKSSFNNELSDRVATSIVNKSLELSKDGIIDIMQKNLFDDILIQSTKHTPLKLKTR